MKNIWKIALMVAAIMTSCNQPDIDEFNPNKGNNDNGIQFYAASDANRTTYFEGDEDLGINWESGDNVSIRISDSNVTNDPTRQRGNYIADQSGKETSFSRTDTWEDAMQWLTEKDSYITAFYPATNNASPKAVALSAFAEQTQSAANNHDHISKYMVMKTSKRCFKVNESKPEAVGLTFRNIYSIVELTLKGDGEEVKNITLTSSSPLALDAKTNANLFTTFEEDDDNGSVKFANENYSNSVVLNLTTPATLTPEGAQFYFVVLPGTHTSGEIQFIVTTTDDNKRLLTMDGITFKMNNVYRPNFAYSETESGEKFATIKHIFNEGYSLPVPFENGARVIMERYNYPLANVPVMLSGFDVATIVPSTYPTTNKIVAETEGWAYIMVGASGSKTVANSEKAKEWFAEGGWEPASAIPTEELTAAPTDENMLYYTTTSAPGAMVLYKRYMAVGDEFDLSGYSSVVNNFQGIRPVAKKITNESNKLTLHLNFTQDGGQADWAIQSSFNNVSINAYEGEKNYVFPNGTAYTMNFSRTPNEANAAQGGGCALHKDGYLLMYLRYSTAESIGLPTIEGYKLTKVSGTLNATSKATVGISSVAAPADPVYVGESSLALESSNAWELNVNGTEANTSYYFYGTDKVDGNQDLRIKFMTLCYEKAE